MYKIVFCMLLANEVIKNTSEVLLEEDHMAMIKVVDLTKPTTWKDMTQYFDAVEKHWKICINCGVPGLGTAMHLDFASTSAMHPAIIPTEFLLTRLSVIDVSSLTTLNPSLVLSLEVALQWMVLRSDPKEPTLLLFKFGWKEDPVRKRSCICEIPGISYDLAEYIATNMSHVVGVATDAPTLESEQTREFTTRTITNLLGQSGIYMIENVNLKRKVPDAGCMTIAMPLMMLNGHYVPTRLVAFCPAVNTDMRVAVALKKQPSRATHAAMPARRTAGRVHDVNLDEIMN